MVQRVPADRRPAVLVRRRGRPERPARRRRERQPRHGRRRRRAHRGRSAGPTIRATRASPTARAATSSRSAARRSSTAVASRSIAAIGTPRPDASAGTSVDDAVRPAGDPSCTSATRLGAGSAASRRTTRPPTLVEANAPTGSGSTSPGATTAPIFFRNLDDVVIDTGSRQRHVRDPGHAHRRDRARHGRRQRPRRRVLDERQHDGDRRRRQRHGPGRRPAGRLRRSRRPDDAGPSTCSTSIRGVLVVSGAETLIDDDRADTTGDVTIGRRRRRSPATTWARRARSSRSRSTPTAARSSSSSRTASRPTSRCRSPSPRSLTEPGPAADRRSRCASALEALTASVSATSRSRSTSTRTRSASSTTWPASTCPDLGRQPR